MSSLKSLEFFKPFRNDHEADLHKSLTDLISTTYDISTYDVRYSESEVKLLYELDPIIQRGVSEFDAEQLIDGIIDECNYDNYSPAVIIDSMGSEVYLEEKVR